MNPIYNLLSIDFIIAFLADMQNTTVELVQQQQFQVQQIVDERKVGRNILYLVKWVGYPVEQNTWQPYANVKNAEQKIKEWKKSRKVINQRNKLRALNDEKRSLQTQITRNRLRSRTREMNKNTEHFQSQKNALHFKKNELFLRGESAISKQPKQKRQLPKTVKKQQKQYQHKPSKNTTSSKQSSSKIIGKTKNKIGFNNIQTIEIIDSKDIEEIRHSNCVSKFLVSSVQPQVQKHMAQPALFGNQQFNEIEENSHHTDANEQKSQQKSIDEPERYQFAQESKSCTKDHTQCQSPQNEHDQDAQMNKDMHGQLDQMQNRFTIECFDEQLLEKTLPQTQSSEKGMESNILGQNQPEIRHFPINMNLKAFDYKKIKEIIEIFKEDGQKYCKVLYNNGERTEIIPYFDLRAIRSDLLIRFFRKIALKKSIQ